jgi:hypothetical protein
VVDGGLKLDEQEEVEGFIGVIDLPDDIGFPGFEVFGDETFVDPFEGIEIEFANETFLDKGLHEALNEDRVREEELVACIVLACHEIIILLEGGIWQLE